MSRSSASTNQGGRIRFWGTHGAFWGGLWSMFFGGLVLTLPLVGPVIALGYLATSIVAIIEGAVLVGGVSAITAAFYGLGIPKDSFLQYETAIKTNSFIVMAHDTPSQNALAKNILEEADATQVDHHSSGDAKAATKAAALAVG